MWSSIVECDHWRREGEGGGDGKEEEEEERERRRGIEGRLERGDEERKAWMGEVKERKIDRERDMGERAGLYKC